MPAVAIFQLYPGNILSRQQGVIRHLKASDPNSLLPVSQFSTWHSIPEYPIYIVFVSNVLKTWPMKAFSTSVFLPDKSNTTMHSLVNCKFAKHYYKVTFSMWYKWFFPFEKNPKK